MYDQFLEDPSSVHASWRAYFKNIESDSAEPYQAPPSLGKKDGSGQLGSIDEIISALKESGFMDQNDVSAAGISGINEEQSNEAQAEAFRVMALIRSFMAHGHHVADVDPLNLDKVYQEIDLGKVYGNPNKELKSLIDYRKFGFTEADLDK